MRAAGLVAVAASASGCATGPAFTGVEWPPEGQSAVYVYRTSGLLGAGVKHNVMVRGGAHGKLVNGSYKRVVVSDLRYPVIVSAFGCEPITPLLLAPGDVGYVQLMLVNKTVEFGGRHYFDYGCRFVRRSEAEALAALAGLRLAVD